MTAAAPPQASAQNLQLRAATQDDSLCLSVLAMQVFLDTYATNGIRPALAREVLSTYAESAFARDLACSGTLVQVAEVDHHLVGFAQVTLYASHALAPPGPQAELLRLYVQEPFTALGVGTRLLAAAETLAAQAGAQVFWLTPWVYNLRARAFYERRGYRDFGQTLFTVEGESHENRVYAKRLLPPEHGH